MDPSCSTAKPPRRPAAGMCGARYRLRGRLVVGHLLAVYAKRCSTASQANESAPYRPSLCSPALTSIARRRARVDSALARWLPLPGLLEEQAKPSSGGEIAASQEAVVQSPSHLREERTDVGVPLGQR
jgi:hypothetical protein